MVSQGSETLNDVFDKLADELNISKAMEDKAVGAYKALGEWVDGNSEGRAVDSYPQGSFALGTVVRPPSGEDLDYDIDLVCQIPSMSASLPREIKQFVGDRIRLHGTYARKLEPEGKRCWTLAYDEFHVDVLPCVDDVESGDPYIRLTHKEPGTGRYDNRYGNPKGYKSWFENCMGDVLQEAKRRYSGIAHCSVDDVPTYAVKTPLQKAVQILKHHRNLMFEGRDNAPISIIITTLAAQAYLGEAGTYDALIGILGRMRSYIGGAEGSYSIPNPADPRENFADKWNEEPAKAAAFFEWLSRAKADFESLVWVHGLDKIGARLEGSVGEIMAGKALKGYGEGIRGKRKAGSLFVAGASGLTGASSAGRAVPGHEFYG